MVLVVTMGYITFLQKFKDFYLQAFEIRKLDSKDFILQTKISNSNNSKPLFLSKKLKVSGISRDKIKNILITALHIFMGGFRTPVTKHIILKLFAIISNSCASTSAVKQFC